MPLLADAPTIARNNLERIRDGKRAPTVAIGSLSLAQLTAINANRAEQDLPPIIAEVVFIGGHIYKSRILKDGYTIEDVIDQISSAMELTAIALYPSEMAVMENSVQRADRYGNQIKDRAVFECTRRHPRPELFSVIPKGDIIKPVK